MKLTPISILTAVLTTTTISVGAIFAQTATDSSVIKSIREAVENTVQNPSSKKLGMVGQILERTGTNLKISVDGKEWTVATTDQTSYEKIPGKTKLKIEDLAIQDYAIIKGNSSSTKQTIDAELIQTIPTPDFPDRDLYTGTIKTIDKQGFTLTTTDSEPIIKVTTSTKIYNESSPSSTLKLSNLSAKQTVMVAGDVTNDKTGAMTADIVLIPVQD